MMDRDNITRTGAKDPWGREAMVSLEQWLTEAPVDLDAVPGGYLTWK